MKKRLWNKITAFCIVLFLACLGLATALCINYGKNAVNSTTVSTEAVGISSTIASYDSETSDSDAAAYYKALSSSAYTAAMTAEAETDTTDYGEINYFCISDDLISDGEFLEHRLENLPEGIVFDYDNKTLYLTDVTTDSDVLIDGGYLTIIVSGECNINHLWINNAKVEIIGGGNLNIGSYEIDEAISMPGGSNLTITDGVTVTTYAKQTSVACGGGNDYLTITGEASLNAWVYLTGDVYEDPMAVWLNGTMLIENGTLTTNKGYICEDGTVTLAENGIMNLIPLEGDLDRVRLSIADNANFIIDGGIFNYDKTNELDSYTNSMINISANLIIKSGSFNTYPQQKDGTYTCDLSVGGTFTQTGGEVNIGANIIGINNCNYYFLGGTAYVHGVADIMGSTFTVNGGKLTIDSIVTGHNDCAMNINSGSTLCVLDGELIVTNNNPVTHALGWDGSSYILLVGGITTLNSVSIDLMYFSSYGSHISIGSGMYIIDGDGEVLTLNAKSDSLKSSTNTATISGNGGEFSSAMSITSSNITVGTSFTVMHAVSLGVTEGTVSFVLPDGMVFTENSLTVNSEVADYDYNGNTVTVSLSGNGSAVIRFSATVTAAGDYTIRATANANGTEYSDSCTFTAKAFTISIPTQTSRTSIPVSGTAAANSTITFYNENNIAIGSATATSLGNWSAEVAIGIVGENNIYVIITLPSGEKITSDTYVVIYDPDCEEVSTLTMTNVYHGQTSVDPDITGVLVIDYINGTSSASYYTYDPSHPTFEYEVAFTKDADKVGSVYVITTDSYGDETVCKLTYDSESGTWKGSCDYTELTAPCYFQVAWESPEDDGTTEGDTTDGETDDGDADETVDNSDGLYISTDDTNFTFAVYDVNYLTLCDTAGEEMEFYYQYSESDGWYVVSSDFSAGLLYTAELSSGTFPEYEDYNALYIVIEGSTGVSGYYEYNDVVIEVETLGSLSDYSVGDVIVVANSEAYVVTEDGFEDAGIEDVYNELYVTQDDWLVDQAVFDVDEEAILAEFKNSTVYEAAVAAVSRAVSQSREFKFEKFVLTVKHEQDVEKGYMNHKFTLEFKFDSAKDGTTSTGTKSGASISFIYETEQKISMLEEKKPGETSYSYFALTNTYSVGFEAKIYAGKEYSENTDLLEKYFVEEYNGRTLEKIYEMQGSKQTSPEFGKVIVPTSIPGIFVKFAVSLDFEWGYSGDIEAGGTLSFKSACGVQCTRSKVETFFNTLSTASGEAYVEGHVNISTGVHVNVDLGFSVLNALDLVIEASIGPEFSVEGHGIVSTDSSNSKAEITAKLVLAAEFKVKIKFNLPKNFQNETIQKINENLSRTIYETDYDIWKLGYAVMPYQFSITETETIYVTDGSDLTNLVSLYLTGQSFTIGSDTIPIVEETYDISKYSFEIVSDNKYGILISNEGIVVIPYYTEIDDTYLFQVRVTYSGTYQLYKTVTLCYSPATITVYKDIDGASKVATFTVTDKDTGVMLGYLYTNENGVGTYPVEVDKTYIVTEVSCADGYIALVDTQVIESNGSATFYNVEKQKINYTAIVDEPKVLDPSGYVYEGSEDFRLSGVTVTIYYSESGPDENGNVADAVIWNAEDYDQQNPLTTNASGEYMWNVPDGWWQVVYEKDGYETAYSDWMTVPPTRTGVNVNLITYSEAELSLVSVDGNTFTFKFNHPVTASSLYNGFTIEYGGETLNGTIEFIDCGLSDDNVLLVMSFSFTVNGDWYESAAATVSYSVTTYTGTECGGTLDIEISATMQTINISYVMVDGTIIAEYEVTVSIDSLDWMLWYYGYLYLPEGYDYTEYNYNNGDLVVTVEEIVTEPVDPEDPEDPVEPDDPETPDDPVTDDPDDPIDTEDPETPDDTGNDDDIQEPADSGSSDETGASKWVIAVAVGVAAVVVICGAVIFVIRKRKK